MLIRQLPPEAFQLGLGSRGPPPGNTGRQPEWQLWISSFSKMKFSYSPLFCSSLLYNCSPWLYWSPGNILPRICLDRKLPERVARKCKLTLIQCGPTKMYCVVSVWPKYYLCGHTDDPGHILCVNNPNRISIHNTQWTGGSASKVL